MKSSDEKLSETRQKMYSLQLKRRDCTIQEQQKEVIDGKIVINGLQKKVAHQESQVVSLRGKIDRLRHREAYWKKQHKTFKQLGDEEVKHAIAEEKHTQMKLNQEVAELEQENMQLRDTVEEVLAKNVITFEKGKYVDDVRACCYEFNVGVRKL